MTKRPAAFESEDSKRCPTPPGSIAHSLSLFGGCVVVGGGGGGVGVGGGGVSFSTHS